MMMKKKDNCFVCLRVCAVLCGGEGTKDGRKEGMGDKTK